MSVKYLTPVLGASLLLREQLHIITYVDQNPDIIVVITLDLFLIYSKAFPFLNTNKPLFPSLSRSFEKSNLFNPSNYFLFAYTMSRRLVFLLRFRQPEHEPYPISLSGAFIASADSIIAVILMTVSIVDIVIAKSLLLLSLL